MAESSIVLELQRLATDKQTDIGDLLRKALIVATKLKLTGFRDWINHELHGYGAGDEVPEYRLVHCELKAINPYHGYIPMLLEDSRLADALLNVRLRAPIGNLIHVLAEKENGGELVMPFSNEQKAILMRMQEYPAFEPIRIVARNELANIVDTVRTSLLEWSLKLEEEGILGSGLTFSREEQDKAAASTSIHIESFQGSFQGILGNVSHSSVQQTLTTTIQKGDFSSLQKYLSSLGLENADLDELDDAIKRDPPPAEPKAFGPAVSSWMGKIMSKVANGGINMAIGTAGSLIANAIWLYYGFGQ